MTATSRLLLPLLCLIFAPLPVAAAVINVGPGGTTLAQALIDAQAAGDDEIRIAIGDHAVNVVHNNSTTDTLTISGGWDPTFTTQTLNPALSVLDGGGTERTFYLGVNDGRVEIRNLTVRNGRAFTGAGLEASLNGSGELLLADLVIRDNVASWEFASNGGGLKIYAQGNAIAEVVDCVIRDNRTVSTDNSTLGGGAYLGASGNAQVLVSGTLFRDNDAEAPNNPKGGGVHIEAFEQAVFELTRNEIRGNLLLGGADSAGAGAGAGLSAVLIGTAALDLRASKIADNFDESGTPASHQLYVLADSEATATLGDSQISGGNGGGALLRAFTASSIKLVNLTVAENPGDGLVLERFASATTTMFSSILWGNGGVEFASNQAPNSLTRNLIEGAAGGSNPLFVNALDGNYRLRAGSPAIDQGDATPDGGIGVIDADGGERRIGENVDQGAYEFGAFHIFFDGFEG